MKSPTCARASETSTVRDHSRAPRQRQLPACGCALGSRNSPCAVRRLRNTSCLVARLCLEPRDILAGYGTRTVPTTLGDWIPALLAATLDGGVGGHLGLEDSCPGRSDVMHAPRGTLRMGVAAALAGALVCGLGLGEARSDAGAAPPECRRAGGERFLSMFSVRLGAPSRQTKWASSMRMPI